MQKTTESGVVIYRGPSELDGKPITAIMTYKSRNEKTGNMAQTFIIREDISPLDALKTGADASICGECRHRPDGDGNRSCYVNVGQSVAGVWRSYHRGIYPSATSLGEAGRGRVIRLGAYGDPAAVPVRVWDALLAQASGWTGYSHQWHLPQFADMRRYCMASADNEREYSAAIAAGWRAFRVRKASEPLQSAEIVCPASAEGGKRVQCLACQLCAGASKSAKSIAIVAHGRGAKHFGQVEVAQ